MTDSIELARIQAWAFRCPTPRPVATSFGIMHDRPAVFVRVEDRGGAFGWGEIFANWPAAGAEHRVRLLELDIAPLVLGQQIAAPSDLFHLLEDRTRIRAVQCGELGPFRQVIAGLDIAVWDLFARKAGVPLRKYIRADAPDTVATYASGIQIAAAQDVLPVARNAGFDAFKLKVGFDPNSEITQIQSIFADLGKGEQIAVDANQCWSPDEALRFLRGTSEWPLTWLEEPIPVFSDAGAWQALALQSPVVLAGGENIAGFDDFADAIALGALGVLQPDVAKWGGITGNLCVARGALRAGRRYCPHFLGGGIGLMASAELLAAVGGDGMLEVDVNPNPLRSAFWHGGEPVRAGQWHCQNQPGLGIDAIPESLAGYEAARIDLRKPR